MSLEIDFKKLCRAAFDLLIKSLKTWETILSERAPEIFGEFFVHLEFSFPGLRHLYQLFLGVCVFRYQLFIVTNQKRCNFRSSEEVSIIPPLRLPPWSLLLINLILQSRTVWGGLNP